ncbi:hypothetical protein ASG43_21790 [Aureimonas sp. Leaf454]|nr:hypothetical protein ASG43_21790 [Aureimonas sp. Leaf454]
MQAAIIGAGATFLAAAIGFTAVVWQIGRQTKATLKQNKALESLRISARVYDEISSATWDTVRASAQVVGYTERFKNQIVVQQLAAGAIPGARLSEFSAVFSTFSDAHLHLLRTIEKWRVVDLRTQVFMDALNSANHDYRETYIGYHQLAQRIMPVEFPAPDGGILLHWTAPSIEQKTELANLQQQLILASSAYSMVTHDLEIEMQNALVGSVFNRGSVPKRRPMDPALKVITLDDHKDLSRYFNSEETAWGREKSASEQRVQNEGVR